MSSYVHQEAFSVYDLMIMIMIIIMIMIGPDLSLFVWNRLGGYVERMKFKVKKGIFQTILLKYKSKSLKKMLLCIWKCSLSNNRHFTWITLYAVVFR